jgi:hypothetical protein
MPKVCEARGPSSASLIKLPSASFIAGEYEKFQHTLHILPLASLGDAHQFAIAQLLHARHLLVQFGGLVLYVGGASP